MTELLTIVVEGRTAEEAQEAARKWTHAEPNIRLVKLTRVRPMVMPSGTAWPNHWSVEIAYVTDAQMDAGL